MITASTTGWGWEGRALGKKKKKNSQNSPPASALSDANTWRRDGWAAAPPTFPAPLDFPAKDSICTEPSGGRWRRGARVCARVCARVAAERLPLQQPSLGLQEVPKSQWLPGPGSPGADRRPPPPTTLTSSPPSCAGPAPSRLLSGARPLALSPDARSRWLRTWRLSRSGKGGRPLGAGGGGPGAPAARAGAGAPRPAERAVIGAGARARPAAAGAGRAPPVRPARRAARTGSRSARGRPAAERAPSRMPTAGSLAPDAAGRAARPQVSASARTGPRKAPPGRSARPRRAPPGAGLGGERQAGGGIRAEFPSASPSFRCAAGRRGSAGQHRRAYRAAGARPPESPSRAPPGAARVGEFGARADPRTLPMKR